METRHQGDRGWEHFRQHFEHFPLRRLPSFHSRHRLPRPERPPRPGPLPHVRPEPARHSATSCTQSATRRHPAPVPELGALGADRGSLAPAPVAASCSFPASPTPPRGAPAPARSRTPLTHACPATRTHAHAQHLPTSPFLPPAPRPEESLKRSPDLPLPCQSLSPPQDEPRTPGLPECVRPPGAPPALRPSAPLLTPSLLLLSTDVY